MTTIKEQMRQDLTTAMKAGDSETVATVRMALTAVTKAEVAGKAAKELSDEEVVAVLTGEAKRRREAAEAFAQAGRTELADKETVEAAILARYLPEPLSAADLDNLVAAAVAAAAEEGLTGGRAMGSVMKALKPQTAGRADGAELAAKVKSALGMG